MNLISLKLIFRLVSLRYVLSGNCIVVEVELNRFVITPAVPSIDIWNIALSLSLFLQKSFLLLPFLIFCSFSILTLLCPTDLIDALHGNLAQDGNDAIPRVMHHCRSGCALDPYEMLKPLLEEDAAVKKCNDRHKYYVTPQLEHWPRYDASVKKFLHPSCGAVPDDYASMPSMLDLTKEEALSLCLAHVFVDKSSHTGKFGPTSATPNHRKNSLVRGAFISTSVKPSSDRAQAAFNWLCENNTTYHYWYQRHEKWLSLRVPGGDGFSSPWFKTSDLLLNTDGFEVAFRPWLYPLASFGETDIKQRLRLLGRAEALSHVSIKDSFMHKVCSRVQDYSQDFLLQSYLYDVSSARTFMSILYRAEEQKCPPEIIAVSNHNFDVYWHNQHRFLTDRCRVRGIPNVFLTIAPAEWRFPLHLPLFARYYKAQKLQRVQTRA